MRRDYAGATKPAAREILSFKLIISENACIVPLDPIAKSSCLRSSRARVMHPPSPLPRAHLLYHLLPLDQFQSRIEPFVTVERELWRFIYFSLVPCASASTSVHARNHRSIYLRSQNQHSTDLFKSRNDFP